MTKPSWEDRFFAGAGTMVFLLVAGLFFHGVYFLLTATPQQRGTDGYLVTQVAVGVVLFFILAPILGWVLLDAIPALVGFFGELLGGEST